jgi:hypothetical protein
MKRSQAQQAWGRGWKAPIKAQQPKTSWWLSDGTRDDFYARQAEEERRMRGQTVAIEGQNRVVGTAFGKV